MHPEEIVEAGGIILTLLDTLFLTTNGCLMWVSGTRQEEIIRWDFSRPTSISSHISLFVCLARDITPVDLVTSAHIIASGSHNYGVFNLRGD